jgi:hypothetical protein
MGHKSELVYVSTNKLMNPHYLLSSIDTDIAGIIMPNTSNSTIENLASSIKRKGQHSPVLVYNEKLVDGRHRCLACKLLGIEVNTNIIDPSTSRQEVEDYITTIEFMVKDLTTWQKALIAYTRYMVNRKFSATKTAKEANIRKHNLLAIKTIAEHQYACDHNWIYKISIGAAIQLPDGSYTTSGAKLVNTLKDMDKQEYDLDITTPKKQPVINYAKALEEYDVDNKIDTAFWELKPVDIEKSIHCMGLLLEIAYDTFKPELHLPNIRALVYNGDLEVGQNLKDNTNEYNITK